jgi:predicted nucleotidyltransferase
VLHAAKRLEFLVKPLHLLIWIFTYNLAMVTQSEFQVPKSSKGARIPMRTIRALASHIAEKFDPDEIILFGSHAYGKPDASSDVDLLVVMETPKGEVKTIMEISDSLPPLPFRVDIIARSRTTINRRKNSGDFFLREVTKRGKVLYARSH